MNESTPDVPVAEDSTAQNPAAASAEVPPAAEVDESAAAEQPTEQSNEQSNEPATEPAVATERSEEPAAADEGAETAESDEPAETDAERMSRLEEEGDIAADYLEELLDIADLDGDIDIDVDGDRASVEIAGADRLAKLNRPKGELLDALQELTRLAVQTRTGNRSRLMLDIGGFRAEHKGTLEELAAKAIAEAKESGAPVPMRAMNPFERKVVHDVAKREGLRSESDGDGKNRHVVIYPAA